MSTNPSPAAFVGQAVRVVSKRIKTAGVLLRDEVLDANGETVSVLGCKSGIPGRAVGEVILVTLANNTVVPATITHIHAAHDRFRAAVETKRVPTHLGVGGTGSFGGRPDTEAGVDVADPG